MTNWMQAPEHELRQQTLVEHLIDLKKAIGWSLLFIFFGFLACFSFSELIFDFMRAPIKPYLTGVDGLIFTGPMDKFVAHIKVSLAAGVVVSCPLWLYQVWSFIAPALYRKEKTYAVGFIVSGTFLFLLGAAFTYLVVYPMAFKFLLGFGGTEDKAFIEITKYLSFILTTALAFGLAFEMPLILVILGMMGIVDHNMLRKGRRFAIVAMAVLAALITPPDALSMILMLIPLIGLYELSIVLVRFFERQQASS